MNYRMSATSRLLLWKLVDGQPSRWRDLLFLLCQSSHWHQLAAQLAELDVNNGSASHILCWSLSSLTLRCFTNYLTKSKHKFTNSLLEIKDSNINASQSRLGEEVWAASQPGNALWLWREEHSTNYHDTACDLLVDPDRRPFCVAFHYIMQCMASDRHA